MRRWGCQHEQEATQTDGVCGRVHCGRHLLRCVTVSVPCNATSDTGSGVAVERETVRCNQCVWHREQQA
jgi:hypothetical protein